MGTVWAILLGTFALIPVAAPFVALQWLGEKLMDAAGSTVGYLTGLFHALF